MVPTSWKLQLAWGVIYVVGLTGWTISHTSRDGTWWFVVNLVSCLLIGGLVGFLIAKAGRAEHYQKIVDKIYEEERK